MYLCVPKQHLFLTVVFQLLMCLLRVVCDNRVLSPARFTVFRVSCLPAAAVCRQSAGTTNALHSTCVALQRPLSMDVMWMPVSENGCMSCVGPACTRHVGRIHSTVVRVWFTSNASTAAQLLVVLDAHLAPVASIASLVLCNTCCRKWTLMHLPCVLFAVWFGRAASVGRY